jgi:hypothetical protein
LEHVVRAFAAQVIRRRISQPIVNEQQKARQPAAIAAAHKLDEQPLMFSVPRWFTYLTRVQYKQNQNMLPLLES